MRKIIAVEIHDMEFNRIKRIYSGDNEAWKRLDMVDQSMIRQVLKEHCLVTCGKFVYYPIYEKRNK